MNCRILVALSGFTFDLGLALVGLLVVLVVFTFPYDSGNAIEVLVSEGKERRAVVDIWHEEPIGVVWAVAIILLPVWLSIGFLILGSECMGERQFSPALKAWLWVLCLILAAGGFCFFVVSRQHNPQELWGLSPLRFIPLVLFGFPAGMLASVTHREMRWTTILPSTIAFFVAFCYIAGSKPSLV